MRAACASVFAGALFAVAAAQQPPFRSGVNYVRADVYPTAAGHPVDDLTASAGSCY
jgi:hypothetical protein